MDNFEFEIPGLELEETIEEFEPIYYHYYIIVDNQERITDGWSDGPYPTRDATNVICINKQGSYQFRLFPDGEENPSLYTEDFIPLYKYEDGIVTKRAEEEIKKDRLPTAIEAKAKELRSICHNTIIQGFDYDGHHFSLEETDQLNLTTAAGAIKDGAPSYPYHADGESCRLYTSDEITNIAAAATFHKLYHTTLCNHLLQQLKRVTAWYQLSAISYSPESLSDDLRDNFRSIMTAAQDL